MFFTLTIIINGNNNSQRFNSNFINNKLIIDASFYKREQPSIKEKKNE